ncbi:gliding motility-associated C-terminal domain-containing protein, partial [candidate division KSB1 bacterium]|nr:gliding motility-associated C-terminal domain-containing protein [candidate division KSB1 bacterium]
PFNASTVIRFELNKQQNISLAIFNLLGQEVRILYDGVKSAGNYQAIWDGKNNHGVELPSGLYFCRLTIKENRRVQLIKIMLLR